MSLERGTPPDGEGTRELVLPAQKTPIVVCDVGRIWADEARLRELVARGTAVKEEDYATNPKFWGLAKVLAFWARFCELLAGGPAAKEEHCATDVQFWGLTKILTSSLDNHPSLRVDSTPILEMYGALRRRGQGDAALVARLWPRVDAIIARLSIADEIQRAGGVEAQVAEPEVAPAEVAPAEAPPAEGTPAEREILAFLVANPGAAAKEIGRHVKGIGGPVLNKSDISRLFAPGSWLHSQGCRSPRQIGRGRSGYWPPSCASCTELRN